MTIEILEVQIINDIDGRPECRHAEVIIRNNGTSYRWSVGGLPLEGDLQSVLNAREAELWTAALAVGLPVRIWDTARLDFRAMPNWALWSGTEAAEALRIGILGGMTKVEARAAIATQFNGATTAAAIKAAAIAVLGQLSDAIIDGRDKGHQNAAKAIMHLRDINRI